MRLLYTCSILLFYLSISAQQFQNPDLEGEVEFDVPSTLPPGWEAVPASLPYCFATILGQTDTPDLTGPLGPVPDIGIMGNPYSGNTFMSGLATRENDPPFNRFHEGIMQTVSGFTVDSFYQLSFYQTVIKQINCLDTSGRWIVYLDDSQLFISPTSYSTAAYNELDFDWDLSTVRFQATSESHTFAFLPLDDDSNMFSGDDLDGGLRMGIDSIHLRKSCTLTDDLGPPLYFCQDDEINVVLDVQTSAGNYVWNTGETGPVITVTEPGNYEVTVTGNDGCINYDQVRIIRNELNLDLGADTTICSGETIVLNATTSGAFYTWQDGSSSTTFSATAPGLYWAEIRVGECRTRDSIVIEDSPVTSLNLGSDVEWCAGDSITIIPNLQLPGMTYEWQDGSTVDSFLVTNALAEVTLLATLDSCTHTDTLLVIPTFPPFTLGPDTTICIGQSLLLDASLPNTTYTWQNGSTEATLLATTGGVYTVTLTRGECTISDTLQITELSFGALDLGADTTLCPGAALTLQATVPGANYFWQDQTTHADFVVTVPGFYWVTASLDNCTATDSILISPHPLLPVDLGEDLTLCAGSSLILDASQAGATYLWQDGSEMSNYTVITPGEYGVTVNLGECSSSDLVQVLASPLQPFTLGADTTLCQGEALPLSGPPIADTYLWSDGSTASTLLANTAGIYSLSATLGECTETAALELSYNELAAFSLGADTTLCPGDSLLLVAGNTTADILWSDNSTESNLWVTTAGSYGLTLSLNGCTQSNSLAVDYYAPTTLSLGADTTFCRGTPFLLQPQFTGPPPIYRWQDGADSPSFIVQESGTYALEIENICSTASDAINIIIEECTCEVYLPNAFSPNDDGTNDTFRAYTTCPINDFELNIYNRWGGLRFNSTDLNTGWSAREVAPGVYVYTIRYRDRDGIWQQRMGEVHLVR